MKNEATGSKNIVGMKTFSLENEAQRMKLKNVLQESNVFIREWFKWVL